MNHRTFAYVTCFRCVRACVCSFFRTLLPRQQRGGSKDSRREVFQRSLGRLCTRSVVTKRRRDCCRSRPFFLCLDRAKASFERALQVWHRGKKPEPAVSPFPPLVSLPQVTCTCYSIASSVVKSYYARPGRSLDSRSRVLINDLVCTSSIYSTTKNIVRTGFFC